MISSESRRQSLGAVAVLCCGLTAVACTEELDVVPLPPAESLAVRPSTAVVAPGQTLQLVFQTGRGNEPATPLATGITWRIDDDKIARVDGKGAVTPLAPGIVNVTGTSRNGSARAALLVTPRPVIDLEVRPTALTLLLSGREQVTVAGKLEGGGMVDVTQYSSWTVDDPAILTLEQGSVRAVQYGTTMVRVSVTSSLGTSIPVTVEDGRLEGGAR